MKYKHLSITEREKIYFYLAQVREREKLVSRITLLTEQIANRLKLEEYADFGTKASRTDLKATCLIAEKSQSVMSYRNARSDVG